MSALTVAPLATFALHGSDVRSTYTPCTVDDPMTSGLTASVSDDLLFRFSRLIARSLRAPVVAIVAATDGAGLLTSHYPPSYSIELAGTPALGDALLNLPIHGTETLIVDDLGVELSGSASEALGALGIRAYIALPLAGRGDSRHGVVWVGDTVPRVWSAEEVELVSDVAASVLAELRVTSRLAAAEAHYDRLVTSSPYAIFAVDREGLLVELNGAAGELLGVPVSDAMGRSFIDFIAPEDLAHANDAFGEQLSGRHGIFDVELQILRAGGERRLVQSRTTPILVDGRVVGIHGVSRDITDERAKDGQLRRAERLSSLTTLLSGVAHELNNPLTSIKSFSQLMLLDSRPPDDQESLEVIHREAERAAKIVTDLRLITRQSYGEDSERSVLDLNEVVRSVTKLARFSIESGGIEFREDLTRDPLPIFGHRAKLEQMVLNLLLNAEHAVRCGGDAQRIIVRTRPSRRGLALAVIDSGMGIALEHLDRIFDPFWTTRATGEGTGLGLSVVHSIVVDHGGEVRVESEVGKGSAFTIELPWSSPVLSPTAPETSTYEAPIRLRVLIVEDEAPIRLSLARFLERRGHDVADVENGELALRLVDDAERFDLIVSDLRMPGLGGEELFRRLKSRGDGSERRVVFITGDASSGDAERFLSGTGVPVLLKPFSLPEVAEMLERYADRLLDDPTITNW